jgi:hypothetical protein
MAEDLSQRGPSQGPLPLPPPAEPVEERAEAARALPAARRDSVLLGRFRLVYAALALVVGVAVGSLLVLVGNPVSHGAAWSSWKPSGDPTQRMQDIASYVAPRYRTADGTDQLVAVTVSKPPTVQTVQPVPVEYMVLSNGSGNQDINVMKADDTASYILCGLGDACAIKSGEATPERGRLLRREALELALYTFKYVSGVNSVVALLPPPPGAQTRLAVFFTKDSLEKPLDDPLDRTLAPSDRMTPSSLGTFESSVVSRYADRRTFEYSFQLAGNGSVFMALEPPQLANTGTPQPQGTTTGPTGAPPATP